MKEYTIIELQNIVPRLLQGFLDQTAEFNGLYSLTRSTYENQVKLGAFGNSMKPEIIRLEGECVIPVSTIEGKFTDQFF